MFCVCVGGGGGASIAHARRPRQGAQLPGGWGQGRSSLGECCLRRKESNLGCGRPYSRGAEEGCDVGSRGSWMVGN